MPTVPKNGKGCTRGTRKSRGGTNSSVSFQRGRNGARITSILAQVTCEKRPVNFGHSQLQQGEHRRERCRKISSVMQVNHEQRALISTTLISGNSQQPGEGYSQTKEVGNDFDREVVDRYATRKSAERAFFNELLKDEPKLLDEYNKRISKSASDGYIYWDFLPTLSKKYGRNYCEALNYVQSKIATAQIGRTDDLRVLRGLAVQIMKERKEAQASHLTVCNLWESIVDAIDEKQVRIKSFETRDSDAKVDEVRGVPNAQRKEAQASHLTVCNLWESIVDAIDEKQVRITSFETRDSDVKVDEVRRVPNAQVLESKRVPDAKVDEKVHEVGRRRVLDAKVHNNKIGSLPVRKSKRRSSKNSFLDLLCCCCS